MKFLKSEQIILINREVISKHGGLYGIRDRNLLESALANPKNLFYYKNANIFELGASYGISIVKNHAFIDGNKENRL